MPELSEIRTPAIDRLRAMLRAGPLESDQIVARFGNRQTAQAAIGQLKKRGEITRTEDGYELTSQRQARRKRGYTDAQSNRKLFVKAGPVFMRQYPLPNRAKAVKSVPQRRDSWWMQPMTWEQFTETAKQRFAAPISSLALAGSLDGKV